MKDYIPDGAPVGKIEKYIYYEENTFIMKKIHLL